MRAWLLLALLLGGCGVRLDETPEPAPAPSSPLAPSCPLFPSFAHVWGRASPIGDAWLCESVSSAGQEQVNAGVTIAGGADPCGTEGVVEQLVNDSPRPETLPPQPLSPVSLDGARWLFYALYRSDSSQPFGVAKEGYGVAAFDPTSGRYQPTEQLLWTADRPAFGSGALVEGDDVVLYGCSGGYPEEDCYVARVAKTKVDDLSAYRYLSGGGHETTSIDAAAIAFRGGAPSVSRLADRDRVVVVYAKPLGDRLLMRTGLGPLGPWSKPYEAARCDVPSGGFCASPVIVDQPSPTTLRVSYAVSSLAAGAREAAPKAYSTRLATVTLPAALP